MAGTAKKGGERCKPVTPRVGVVSSVYGSGLRGAQRPGGWRAAGRCALALRTRAVGAAWPWDESIFIRLVAPKCVSGEV